MSQPVVNYDHKTIQVRRGTTTEWRRYGTICIPAEGEICVEFFQNSDGTRNNNVGMKVGNGTGSYKDLPYLITNQNEDDRISDEQINNWDLTVEKLANLTAAEVAQNNSDLGDNVQEALNDLYSRLTAIDPDGGAGIEIDDLNDSFAENLVLQDRTDAQKVVSDFSFEKAGDNPLTMKDTGMYAGSEYVRNKDNVWEVDPSLSVTNDISAGGNLSVEGTTELKGDVTLEGGDLIFNGGGIEGDVSVNGNITIEGGGSIIAPDGKPIGGGAAGTHIGELPPDAPEQGQFWLDISGEAVMWIYDDGKWLQHPSAGGGGAVMASDVALDNPTRVATGLTNQSEANTYFADALSKVVNDDGTVIGPDLSSYYTSTEVDNKLADYYTKSEADSAFADATHTHPEYALASKFVICTQAEYDGLSPDAGTVYFIK